MSKVKWFLLSRPLYVQLLFTFLAFLVLVVFSIAFTSRIVSADLIRNAESVLDYMEAEINAEMMQSYTILDEFAQAVQSLLRDGYDARKLTVFAKDMSENIFSKNNDTFSSNGLYGYIEKSPYGPICFFGNQWQPPDDWYPPSRNWYKAAVEEAGGIAETTPYLDIVTNEIVSTFSRCIFDSKGGIIGVVAIDVRTGYIGERASNTALTKGGFGILTDQELVIIGHLNKDFLGLKMYNPIIPLAFLTDELVLTGKISGVEWINWLGEKVTGFFTTLPNGWRLGLLAVTDIYYKPVYNMALTFSILGTILAAVLMIILIRVDAAKIRSDTESKNKSEFLANMSHELRTPLNVIIGLTDLILEDEQLDKNITGNLVKVNNAGSTLLNIVNDILDFSKIESGKLSISPVEYYTSSLVNDVITLTITRLGEKQIKFILDIPDDLPNKMYGDDLRVKQVLTNLLTNSVKYTREGSIKLSIYCTRDGDTVWMDVAVSDTGMGIPKDKIKNLFHDYYQVDSKANRKIEGTGLGLSITQRLVSMMDGKINVESDQGKGSKFSFRIRQGFVEETVLGKDVSDKLRNFCYIDDKRLATQKLVRINLSYARVLVVDDMQTNLDVASGLLCKYHMQVDCLTNGQSAVDRIKSGIPVYNAIFMDHMMPGMDGIETADKIRAIGTEYAKNIPIIALTANAIQGTEKMFFEHNFQAFVTKPIDVMELDAALRKWVRDKIHDDAPVTDDFSSEKEIVIDIPGVDSKKGLALYADDTGIYLPLLRSYITNTPNTLEKLKNVTAENLSDYVISVHGLKGTSAGIGAEDIRAQALELENLSRAGDLQGVLARNGKLIADTEVIVANVKAWLDKNDVKEAKPRLKAPDRELLAKLRAACESYDMDGIEEIMAKLESADYEEETDLIKWMREKIDISKMGEVAQRLSAL